MTHAIAVNIPGSMRFARLLHMTPPIGLTATIYSQIAMEKQIDGKSYHEIMIYILRLNAREKTRYTASIIRNTGREYIKTEYDDRKKSSAILIINDEIAIPAIQ